MTAPRVSIVLPVYNGERYLDQAIRSCLAQTFRNWELIVVNDASTDSTQAIIDRYLAEDPRVRCVVHEKNRKLPGGLNSGFAVTRGEYLTWTSDDNLYRPEALAEMAAVLDREPGYAIVYSDYQVIDEGGAPLHEVQVARPEDLVLRNTIGACFLYRREVHERLSGYDETKFLVEDYDFWLRASKEFKIAPPIRKILYKYRIHGGTLTARRSHEIHNALMLLLARHLPGMWWAGRRKISQGYVLLADATTFSGLTGWGVYYYLKAVIVWPSVKNIFKAMDIINYKTMVKLKNLMSNEYIK